MRDMNSKTNSLLVELYTVLAELYGEESRSHASRILMELNLPTKYLDLNGSPITIWKNVVMYAFNNNPSNIIDLIGKIRDEFPKRVDLIDLEKRFLKDQTIRGPGLPPAKLLESPANDFNRTMDTKNGTIDVNKPSVNNIIVQFLISFLASIAASVVIALFMSLVGLSKSLCFSLSPWSVGLPVTGLALLIFSLFLFKMNRITSILFATCAALMILTGLLFMNLSLKRIITVRVNNTYGLQSCDIRISHDDIIVSEFYLRPGFNTTTFSTCIKCDTFTVEFDSISYDYISPLNVSNGTRFMDLNSLYMKYIAIIDSPFVDSILIMLCDAISYYKADNFNKSCKLFENVIKSINDIHAGRFNKQSLDSIINQANGKSTQTKSIIFNNFFKAYSIDCP